MTYTDRNLPSDKDLNMEEIILTRSLISVYGVSGEISSDGSYSTIKLERPTFREKDSAYVEQNGATRNITRAPEVTMCNRL